MATDQHNTLTSTNKERQHILIFEPSKKPEDNFIANRNLLKVATVKFWKEYGKKYTLFAYKGTSVQMVY